ncbi:MAG: response regulator [Bacteriovoracaceae bacterium]|nr:response regulator [Bacteriovoracaceae bacterium]
MTTNKTIKILIVDDEIDVADIINFLVLDLLQINIKTTISHSGNEAIKALDLENYDYCICDHNMPNGSGDVVLKHIIKNNLATQFILCSTVTPISHHDEYPKDKILFNIEKPGVIAGIEKLANIILKKLDPEEKAHLTPEFHPIPVHYLKLFQDIPLDIYIQLGPDRFVKFYNEGDHFTTVDENNISEKSITTVYIKATDHVSGINDIIHNAVISIFDKKHLPIQDKITINFNDLVQLINFTGITNDLAKTIKDSIFQATKIIAQSNELTPAWSKINLIGEFPAKLYCLQSLICGAILKKHSWNSEQTLYKLAMASFLQDLSLSEISLMELYDYSEFLEKEDQFTRQSRSSYLAHPLKARDLAIKITGLPPDIEKLVAEQHEAPEGLGFPRKTNATQLQPLSCLFILSGFTARYILRNQKNFSYADLIDELDKKGYKSGNFKESFLVLSQFKI